MYQTFAEAFVGELRHLLINGTQQTVRATTTLEVLNRTITITQPLDRSIVVPHRRSDPFAAIAETMWVLAGRDDLAYLTHYLPRAPDFSDDGVTWRGAYGPRLRAWGQHRTDQVAAVVDLLLRDPQSRRAVINLYDPARDLGPTRDVPCNNWLHFLVRDGHLHLNVAVRSNDIMWGFSGINTYEWSVLQELVAHWVGVPAGSITFFISSLHLYDRHSERAQRIVSSATTTAARSSGPGARFTTAFTDFDAALKQWFELESLLRRGEHESVDIDAVADPMLRENLRMLRIAAMQKASMPQARVRDEIMALNDAGNRLAANEYLFRSVTTEAQSRVSQGDNPERELRRYMRNLHRAKDATYGSSWKRRGEAMGIMANLARKSDRLETLAVRAPEDGETLLDTVVDLLIYGLKYQTFLADLDADLAGHLLPNASRPFSEGASAFEQLLANLSPVASPHPPSLLIVPVVAAFQNLEETFISGLSSPSDRSALLTVLIREAFTLATAIARLAIQQANGATDSAWPPVQNNVIARDLP